MIASSLALALGVSVATAESTNIDNLLYSNPLIQTRASDPILEIDGAIYKNYLSPNLENSSTPSAGVVWKSQSDNMISLYSSQVATQNSNNGIIKNIEVNFNDGRRTKLWTGSNGTLTICPGNESGTKFSFNSNGQGLKLGENGDGELKIMFGLAGSVAPRDLQTTFNFSNTSGNAVMGNILIQGGYANSYPSDPITHATLTFNGNLKGSLKVKEEPTAKGYLPVVKAIFQGNSNLDGDFDTDIGITTLLFDHGGITGNVSISLTASPTILRTSGEDMVIGREGGFIGGKLSLSALENDPVFDNTYLTLGYADNTTGSKTITLNPEDTNKFEIVKGVITFQNMKKLRFADENNTLKTLYIQQGKLDQSIFNFDRTLLTEPNETLIVEGNIHAQDGRSLRLSFIDDGVSEALDQDNLKTFTINGNITVDGGGLSLFYNDRTNSFEGKVKAINGGTITQTGGYIGRNDAWFKSGTFQANSNDILTIQGIQGGISHLKFEDAVDITNGIGSSGGNGVELLFGNDVTIGAFVNDAKKMDATSVGKAIYLNNGTNTITFGGNATINGDIFTSRGDNILTFNGNGTNTISGAITANGGNNNLTFNSGNSTIVGNINADGGNNIININANTTASLGSIQARRYGQNTINISNSAVTMDSIKITAIDADNLRDGGKNIVNFSGGNSLTVSNGISTEGRWSSSGSNEINIKSDNATLAISNGGLTTRKMSFPFSRDYMQQNTITFDNGGNLTLSGTDRTESDTNFNFDGILARDGNKNTITFNGSNNATIKAVDIRTKDGESTNDITFNGGGENKIQGIISNYGGTTNITFASGTNTITGMDGQSNGDGGIFTSGGVTTITFKGGTNSISGLVDNDNASSWKGSAIVNRGGTLKINLEGGSLAVNREDSINDSRAVFHRVDGGKTEFNVDSSSSSLTLHKVVINGRGESNQGVFFNFKKGGTLDVDTLTLKNEWKSLGFTNPKATFNYGGDGSIKGNITSENGHEGDSFTKDDTALLTFNLGSTTRQVSGTQSVVTRQGTTTFANGLHQTINFNGDNFTFANKDTDGSNYQGLSIDSDKSSNTINFNANNGVFDMGTQTLAVSNGSNTINIANGASGTIIGNITTRDSGVTTINFASGTNTSSLSLSGTNTISSVNIGGDNNKLTLSNGKTTITNQVKVGESNTQALLFTLADGTELALTNGLATGNSGTSTIRVENATNGVVLSGGDITATNLDMVGSSKVTFKSNTTIETLTAQAEGGNELVIGDTGNTSLTIGTTNSTLKAIELKGTNSSLAINGGNQTIQTLTTNATTNNIALNGTTTAINSQLSKGSNTLNLTLTNATLSLGGETNSISKLDVSGSVIVDLGRVNANGIPMDQIRSASPRKTLTIDNFSSGSANFILYANSSSADKVTITDAGNDTQATISVVGGKDIYNITYTENGSNNVMVAKLESSAKDKVKVVGGESMIGAEVIDITLQEVDNSGTEYYIGKVVDRGIHESYQEIANSALTVNYDLFLANFNSLNKRMGELRDNPYNQGVWARVFGGAMSNDFGAGSKTDYLTAQAGYDYSLSLGNARNYMGIAVAYGKSWTKGNDVSTANIVNGVGEFSLSNVNSNMVEVGIYNSYVSESGWYNDTIFKFDYIMSEFALSNDPNTMSNTSNFAMVLSDEFGYRYSFGVSEKGSWYIDPQAEFAFGYFNQSDFNRAVYDASMNATDLNAKQDTILTLRSRAGLSLGKKFNTERGFASLYVGAFYEYDYIEGGNAQATGRVGGTITQLDKVESNGRAIVNVGSNIELMDGVRMYIDVEKSFGDKQRTDMQFNFGARYSFGERSATLSKQTQQRKEIAPLKVSEENASVQEDSQTNSQEKSGNTQE